MLVVPNSKIPNPYPLCPLHKRVSVPKNCRGKAWAWSASQNFFLRDGKVGWRKSDSLKNWSSLWTAGFQLQLPPALSEIIIFCFTKFIYWAEWTTISDTVCNNQEFWSKAQRKAFFWVTVLFTLKLLLHQLQNTIRLQVIRKCELTSGTGYIFSQSKISFDKSIIHWEAPV